MRALLREQGLEDAVEIDSAGTGRMAPRRPARRARDGGGAGPRHRARGRRAPGRPRRLRRLRPDPRRRPAATCATWRRSCRPARGRGCTCCGSSTRPPPARRTSTSRIPTTAATTASSTCSTSSRRPAAACSTRCAPTAGCDGGRGRRRRARAAARARRAGRGRRHQRRLADRARRRDAGVRQGARRRAAGRVRDGGRRAALARGRRRRPRPCPTCSPRTTAFLALEWLDEGRLDAAGEEALGRGLAQAARGRARPRSARRRPARRSAGCGSARSSCRPRPADDWPAFYAAHRLAPLVREAERRGALPPGGRAAIEDVIARAAGARRAARAAGAAARRPVERQRPRRRATARPWLIDPAAYGGHREVDLAMLRLFGAPSPRTLAAYAEVAAARRRPRGARAAVAAAAAARPRGPVRRRLRRGGGPCRAPRCAMIRRHGPGHRGARSRS